MNLKEYLVEMKPDDSYYVLEGLYTIEDLKKLVDTHRLLTDKESATLLSGNSMGKTKIIHIKK